MELFDDDIHPGKEKLHVNQDFAQNYEIKKRKQALQNAEQEGMLDGDSGSSSSDEDSDGDVLTAQLDLQIADTLKAIRQRDPKIYDSTHAFFGEDDEDEDDEETQKKRKPYNVADHLRDEVLHGHEVEPAEPVISHEEELATLKRCFLDAADDATQNKNKNKTTANDSDNDEEGFGLVARKKSGVEEEQEDAEFDSFMTEQHASKKFKEKNQKKALQRFYDESADLNPTEKFLWEYIKNEGWVDKEAMEVPTYNQIVEDDSAQEDQHDEYERKYNFRFEEQEGTQVETHARNHEGGLRRKDDSRKRKRKEREDRKAADKAAKVEELKRLKNLKKQELAAKLKELQGVAGAEGAMFEKVDLDAEWDPDAHEVDMNKAFDEDYYQGDEEDAAKLLAQVGAEIEEEGWGNWEDEETWFEQAEEGTNESRHANKKNKSKKDKVDLGEYIDKYYELDYEDVVAGMPTRFKYHQVAAADYGLSPEEILLLPDKTLNQYASLKKYAPFRDDATQTGKKYTTRRWEHYKMKNGLSTELDELYKELDQKKGAPQAKQSSTKAKSRAARRRDFAEGLKKVTNKNLPMKQDRMALYNNINPE
eukprot:TRINITY_DN4509_c0_g1_i5.p1 TRINITY_DN4509_c0_g1~~TRINITY_DN4509_c0_g1_i5.p1  ORF type:complete len:591 (-),score=211.37 TRINITY_DN4509_c0_g1_i5:251-2023(-)